jgi:hypothetical protein
MDRIWLFILKFEARMCTTHPAELAARADTQNVWFAADVMKNPSFTVVTNWDVYMILPRCSDALSVEDSRSQIGEVGLELQSGVRPMTSASLSGPEIHGDFIKW